MDNNNSQQKETSTLSTALKGIALILGMFILGNIIGSLTNIKRVDNFATVNNQTTVTESVIVTTLPSTTEPSTIQTTTQVTTTEPTTAVATTENVVDRKAEIVSLFNESANKVKKSAKKVTRNYENLSFDENKSDIPVPLYIAGRSLINSWLVNHDTPIEYVQKNNLIKANFPVKGKDWSSKLTANDVAEATLTEKDGKYHIVIELEGCKDPAPNTGVCAVMEEVNTEKVRELADIVRTCETEYYDCRIECVVEKSTGNMVYVKYTEPMRLNLTAGRVTEMSAVFAMTIESEFEIAY